MHVSTVQKITLNASLILDKPFVPSMNLGPLYT
jgi:hypothetical protein